MSYEIEHGKRVLTVPTSDDRLSAYLGQPVVYLAAMSSNNVSPRTYDWSVIALDNFSEWAGEIQLPARIWELGHAADGGGIQPWGKTVSGLSYVKSWKQAAKERRSVYDHAGNLLWKPRVSLYMAKERLQELKNKGANLFGTRYQHNREPAYAAFQNLFPKIDYSSPDTYVKHTEDLLNALVLYRLSHECPFSVFISDDEDSAFLRR